MKLKALEYFITLAESQSINEAAEQLFSELGLNLTTAVNMFLRQAIRTGGIPFEIKVDTPNEITAAAIAEGRRIMRDKNAKGYHNMDELKAAFCDLDSTKKGGHLCPPSDMD